MPNPTPIGGISLIAHLAINIIAYAYRKASSFARAKWPSGADYIAKITESRKEGILVLKGILAYGIVVFTFSFFLGLSMIMLRETASSPFVSLGTRAARSVYVSVAKTETLAKKPTLPEYAVAAPLVAPSSSFGSTGLSAARIMGYSSIVDLLDDAGFKDRSLGFRAALAVRLGIVSIERDYTGTADQNVRLLTELKKRAFEE